MSGENLTLSYEGPNGQVVYRGKVYQIQHGVTIISDEDLAATTKAIYTRQVQQDQFIVVTKHSTRTERDAFWRWCIEYGVWAATWSNGAGPVPIRVQGPRDFDMFGVLSTGPQAVTQVQDITWSMTLMFVGGWPASQANFVNTSQYQAGGDPTSALYYPGGIQLSGSQNAQDALYGDPNVLSPSVADPSQPATEVQPVRGAF